MSRRSSREMDALVAKIREQIGPLEKWSEAALENQVKWIVDYQLELSKELAKRDNAKP